MVDAFTCPGGNIGPGTNTLMVRGRQRTFVADFPANPTRRMGILFSWHGYNQAEGQHRTASNLQPDGDPALPVVVITPDDVDFELPVGLDWQLDEGSVDKNVDLQFFEAMVGCLNQQYDIDPARIHSLGYSAGSVMTALLHSVYPRLVRNVICISGMWFNDQKEIDAIIFAGAVLKPTWPALRQEDGGTILLTHGGLTDIAAVIINLETMAQNAFPFLAQAGRVVVDCAHNNGHTGSPDVGPSVISRFISVNPSDIPSPYLSGGYSGFASSCKLRLP
jgi:poly(3-hydroxybutyrate) depolymerase